jgi:hypothetical protein
MPSVPDTDKDGDGNDDGVAQESGDEFDSEVGVNDDEEGGAPRDDTDSASLEPARRYPHRTRKPPARMVTAGIAQYDVPRVTDPMRDLVVTTSDDPSVKVATGASLEERDWRLEAMLNECDFIDAKGTGCQLTLPKARRRQLTSFSESSATPMGWQVGSRLVLSPVETTMSTTTTTR